MMKTQAAAVGLVILLALGACCIKPPALRNQTVDETTSLTAASVASTTTSTLTVSTTVAPLPRNVTCEGKWGDVAKDRCYREWAIGARDPRICEKVVYKSTRDNCYHSIALETRDVSLCNRMLDDLNRKKCFDSIQQAGAT